MKSAFLVTVDPLSLDGSVDLGYNHRFTEVRRTAISTDIAQSLITSFIALPAGYGALCFDPVYVVELRENEKVQWSGSACFRCGTYYSTDGRGPSEGMFDRASNDAAKLLNQLRDLS